MAARRITQLFLVATMIIVGVSSVAVADDSPGHDDGARWWTRSSGAALAVGSAATVYFYARADSTEFGNPALGVTVGSLGVFVGSQLLVVPDSKEDVWGATAASLLTSIGATFIGVSGNSASHNGYQVCYSVEAGSPCVRSLDSADHSHDLLVAGQILLASGVALTTWLTYSNLGSTRSNQQRKTYVAPSAGGLVFGGAF